MSRSTVAKYLRLLRDAGLLGIVESGTTPQFRSFLHADDGNRASVYVLCVPAPVSPVERSRTPSGSRSEHESSPARAREDDAPSFEDDQGKFAATNETRQRSPMLARISPAYLRSTLKPWWEAGWTAGDVLWALDHKPSGELWPHTDRVRHVPGWIRYRLAVWNGVSSPSQQRAAWHAQIRAEQAQRRAERITPADPAPWARQIRQALRGARRCG